jgi:hypothetical protein
VQLAREPGPGAHAPENRKGTDRLQWLEEGAHEVVPGVYRIPLPLPFDGLRAVNVYAIEADDGLVMIDSGWVLDATKDQLERSLARIGAGLGDIRRFLITHIHRDHYTQAIALRKTFGMKVVLGADEKHSLDALLGKESKAMSAQASRLLAAGAQPLIDEMVRAGMLAELADGPRTAYQVALALRWTSRQRALTDLDLMNQMLAVCETVCHLDLLVARGLASAHAEDIVRLYQPGPSTA